MGSFAAFVLLGMYPVPATEQYLLVSPYFPQVSFYNPAFNSTTTIKALLPQSQCDSTAMW